MHSGGCRIRHRGKYLNASRRNARSFFNFFACARLDAASKLGVNSIRRAFCTSSNASAKSSESHFADSLESVRSSTRADVFSSGRNRMDTLRHDIRIALRSLLRTPGVLLVAVLSLGLGISLNTTIFSAVDVFLIRPLPYPDADRILQVWSTNTERGWRESSISAADYYDWRTQARSIDLAAFRGSSFNLTGLDQPERVTALRVASNFFQVLGVNPQMGRAFSAEEEVPGNDRVVIVSDAFWRTQLASDPRVLGRVL